MNQYVRGYYSGGGACNVPISVNPHRVIRFGLFEADLDAAELRKGGLKLKIQEQPFQILALLLSRPGEIVTREDIQQRLWPDGTFVDFDHGVNTAVKKLRETLGDDSDNPRFVETIPKRGYRFIAPLVTEQEPSPPIPTPLRTAHRPFVWAAIAAAAVVAISAVLLWWTSRSDRVAPRIVRSKQLTFSGQIGRPFSTEAPQSIQTDGQRIYYTDPLSRLRSISVTGGEEEYLHTDISNVALLHISPDGSTLLVREFFSSEGSSESPLWLVPTNGGPRRRLGEILAQDAAWSPDGQTIAFAQGQTLFLADDRGNNVRKLATTPGRAFWIRWSPNGKSLRFTVNDSKTQVRTLWQVSMTGSLQPMFANWENRQYSCCGIWSPDGRYYLFLNFNENAQLWTQRERTLLRTNSQPLPMSAHQVGVQFISVASSPLQKRLFVLGLNPLVEAYALNPRNKRPVQLLPNLPVDRPSYSLDGKWVTFFSQDATPALWRARADGTGQIQLTSPPLEVLRSVFSPDATRIAMMGRLPDQPFKIYWVSAEGGALHELSNDITNQADANFTADGQSIIFGEPPDIWVESGKPKAIYVSNLKTGQTSKLPGSDGRFSPRISPDGRLLAAMSLDLRRIGLFDFETSTWRDLPQPKGANDPFWSGDGQWVYYNDNEDGIWRLRVKDGHSEYLLSLSSVLPVHSCFGNGFTPEQFMILSCTRRTSDLYELDWE